MGLGELFVIAVGLSMDAFAVSICKGLSVKRVCPGHVLCTGVYFGGFQMMMPLIGYFLGSQFSHLITRAHGVAVRTLSGSDAVCGMAGDKPFQRLHRVGGPLDSLYTFRRCGSEYDSGILWGRRGGRRIFSSIVDASFGCGHEY